MGVEVTWSDDIPAIGAVSVDLAILLVAVLPVMVVHLAGALRQGAVSTTGHLPCDNNIYCNELLNGMELNCIGIHVILGLVLIQLYVQKTIYNLNYVSAK